LVPFPGQWTAEDNLLPSSERAADSYFNDKKVTPSHTAVKKPNNDLLHSVKGMYRILDLINEQGSGGLGKALAGSTMSQLVVKLIVFFLISR